MDKLEPPQGFSFDGNVSDSWRLYRKYFVLLHAADKDIKGNKTKTSILLKRIGQKGREM